MDLYQRFLVFHTSIFSKTQEELEAARHGRSANLKIWQHIFLALIKPSSPEPPPYTVAVAREAPPTYASLYPEEGGQRKQDNILPV